MISRRDRDPGPIRDGAGLVSFEQMLHRNVHSNHPESLHMRMPLRASLVAFSALALAACAPETRQSNGTALPGTSGEGTPAGDHAAHHPPGASAAIDPGYTGMQTRGQMAMGVDQYTSSHKFDVLPDGGRIELQRNVDDALGVAQIRAHLRLIQHAFQEGDFSTPAFVHMREMPGTLVMAAKRRAIRYSYADLPRGGEVRMTTADSEAHAAIRAFMAAQRSEHRAGGYTPTRRPIADSASRDTSSAGSS